MRKLSNWFNRVSTGWVTLAALVVFILFMILVMPGQTQRANTAYRNAGTPDLSMVYTTNDLYDLADFYGAAGRQGYIQIHFTFDLAWPLIYTFFFVIVTSWVFARAFPLGSRWRLVNLAPLLGMLLDFLENITTSLVMLRYPAHTPIADVLAPVFTFAKWIALGISFVLLVLGILVAIGKWIKGKK